MREFRPLFVSMADDKALARLRARLSDVTGIEYGTGMDGLIHAAAMEQAEIVVTAVSA